MIYQNHRVKAANVMIVHDLNDFKNVKTYPINPFPAINGLRPVDRQFPVSSQPDGCDGERLFISGSTKRNEKEEKKITTKKLKKKMKKIDKLLKSRFFLKKGGEKN